MGWGGVGGVVIWRVCCCGIDKKALSALVAMVSGPMV